MVWILLLGLPNATVKRLIYFRKSNKTSSCCLCARLSVWQNACVLSPVGRTMARWLIDPTDRWPFRAVYTYTALRNNNTNNADPPTTTTPQKKERHKRLTVWCYIFTLYVKFTDFNWISFYAVVLRVYNCFFGCCVDFFSLFCCTACIYFFVLFELSLSWHIIQPSVN